MAIAIVLGMFAFILVVSMRKLDLFTHCHVLAYACGVEVLGKLRIIQTHTCEQETKENR